MSGSLSDLIIILIPFLNYYMLGYKKDERPSSIHVIKPYVRPDLANNHLGLGVWKMDVSKTMI